MSLVCVESALLSLVGFNNRFTFYFPPLVSISGEMIDMLSTEAYLIWVSNDLVGADQVDIIQPACGMFQLYHAVIMLHAGDVFCFQWHHL